MSAWKKTRQISVEKYYISSCGNNSNNNCFHRFNQQPRQARRLASWMCSFLRVDEEELLFPSLASSSFFVPTIIRSQYYCCSSQQLFFVFLASLSSVLSTTIQSSLNFANLFWNDFTRKSVAIFVTWYTLYQQL